MENSVVTGESPVEESEIKSKMHFTGKVLKTTLAGALVDIGKPVQAVLHISQIQPAEEGQTVKRVDDVLKVGQEIEVWVRRVKDDRVELTMFKPLDYDWRDLKKEMVVKGKVVRLEKFGAFVEIGAERPGLIHISELAHGYVRTPSEVVKEGDEVEAMVLEVNRRKKQIKLSLKALQEPPVKEEEPVHPAFEQPARAEKPRRARKAPRRREDGSFGAEAIAYLEEAKSAEPEPTAMEIAMRAAMEKAKERKSQAEKARKAKSVSKEQEDILNRTLENKAQGS
jgi:predicted RNA-binding protein with RPS1 domain